MSSGQPEGPSTNPDDWKSPYSTGPGQTPAYGQNHGRPDHGQGYGQPGYYQPGHTLPGYDQPGYTQPSYGDPGYGQLGYGDPGYGQGHEQGYGQPGHGSQGYGESPYGQYPPRYDYGPGPQQNTDGVRTHAIVALVISIFLGLTCYVSLGGITGAVLSGIALGKVDRDPQGARNLLKWTWISIGINIALVVLGVGAIIVAGVNGAFD
ncbi:hypothetical protein AB0395_02740 [Streptosporangium sp. NPDC051023]|uniref:hypothetical protein n=1 Tax=Streptosporangium sp. NPDC051023 TaxID=3155410 RepID=UPI00344B6804